MSQVEFVAEVSSNHSSNLDRALQFIDVSAEIGCAAVKFQLFRVDKLFAPEILAKSKAHCDRAAWELPVAFLPELANRTHELGMKFCCTPFDLDAVEQLEPWVDFYKVASYELLWDELLQHCAETGKPLVLSTGMATMEEISHAVEVVKTATNCSEGEELTLLHCVSGYPAPIENANLAAIETLRNYFDLPVGWSDHTVNGGVVMRAVHRWNAGMVEFHLDLEGEGEEFQSGHCWLPDEIKRVINEVNQGQFADGNGDKIPMPAEQDDREWRADPEDGLRPLKKIRSVWQ